MDQTYVLSKALPNKWLNPDGSITDGQGNVISPANPSMAKTYENSRAVINKFVDTDGETKTYAEISLNIFIVVDTLPEEGEKNRIYLVPTENGMFDEYFWNENGKWDKIGEVKIDLSNYPTKDEVANAIAANSTADKKYTDEAIKQNITNVLRGEY